MGAAGDDPAAVGDAAANLVGEFVAEVDPRHRAEVVRLIGRFAHPQHAHRRRERLGERVRDRVDGDEPLPGNAALARIQEPGADRAAGCRLDVGVGEDDERVAAAELEDRLLQVKCTGRGDLDPDGLGPGGQGDRRDALIGDQLGDPTAGKDDDLERGVLARRGSHRQAELERAASDVRGMLEHHRVPGHPCRRGGPDQLPDRVVPGHDREDDPEWRELDVGVGPLGRDGLGGEQGGAVVSVVLARPHTLVDLRPRLADHLSHLAGDQVRERLAPGGRARGRSRAAARRAPRSSSPATTGERRTRA